MPQGDEQAKESSEPNVENPGEQAAEIGEPSTEKSTKRPVLNDSTREEG